MGMTMDEELKKRLREREVRREEVEKQVRESMTNALEGFRGKSLNSTTQAELKCALENVLLGYAEELLPLPEVRVSRCWDDPMRFRVELLYPEEGQ